MLTSGHGKMRISVMMLNFGHASQRSDGFEVLDVIPKGSMELKFGHASQRFDGFEVLDMLPRCPMDLNLDVLPRDPMYLKFGCAFQRSIEIEFWTCFLEVRWI